MLSHEQKTRMSQTFRDMKRFSIHRFLRPPTGWHSLAVTILAGGFLFSSQPSSGLLFPPGLDSAKRELPFILAGSCLIIATFIPFLNNDLIRRRKSLVLRWNGSGGRKISEWSGERGFNWRKVWGLLRFDASVRSGKLTAEQVLRLRLDKESSGNVRNYSFPCWIGSRTCNRVKLIFYSKHKVFFKYCTNYKLFELRLKIGLNYNIKNQSL